MAHYSLGPDDAFAGAVSAAKANDSSSYYPQKAYISDLESSSSVLEAVIEEPLAGTEQVVHNPHLADENDEAHDADRADMSWAQGQGVEMQGRHEACRWDAHIAATGSSTSIQD
ncbi:uncharacterized protein N7484_005681 [Penicillium longicatenatum]|uniref:uncharacterized protein n=1 Tax=Penicillium longicatenatum TaxID=1561947 RepID=UPI002547063B|nr:uncharacterized protein N7484_005681 [Penicillium longicatenatum]KAJ5643174.1 hypothetical protein N7484_005681 [Penicillium longicatenatum]